MTLKQEYERICNEYLVAFANKYNIHLKPDTWINGTVGCMAYVCDIFLNFDDIRRCVDEDVKWDDLIEWYDYDMEVVPLGFDHISLDSWLKGAPRVDKERIERVKSLRNEMNEIITEENKKKGGF